MENSQIYIPDEKKALGQSKQVSQSKAMKHTPLKDQWQRHDWQVSPYAPDLRIVQALVAGKTASGAGFSRHDALMRCLGETAEILALNGGESSEGLAAGPDFAFAAERALAERLERWALWDWWHGRLLAQPVQADGLIAKLRQGALKTRDTSLWHLSGFPHIHVIVAFSIRSDSTHPILGFGAHTCPMNAARSSLVELGLMELNLRSPTDTLHRFFTRITKHRRRLFPPANPTELEPVPQRQPLEAGVNFTFENRTPLACELTVVKALVPAAPRWAGSRGPLL